MAICKTTILLTILHEEADDVLSWDIQQIAGELNEGCIVGSMEEATSEEVPEASVKQELWLVGNDGTFFEQN